MTADTIAGWSAAAGGMLAALTDHDLRATFIRALARIDAASIAEAVGVSISVLCVLAVALSVWLWWPGKR